MELAPELQSLLQQKCYGHVVTINSDGSPQVSMVWMDLKDGRPSFNTNNIRAKYRNLQRDPRIIVSVQALDDPQQYALIEGRAEITEEGAFEQIDALAKKYTGNDKYPWLQPGEQRVSVSIDVERVTGMGPWVS